MTETIKCHLTIISSVILSQFREGCPPLKGDYYFGSSDGFANSLSKYISYELQESNK
jgi:hypothetical protein